MISFVAVFCFVMAVYETLEYMFCYDDEKREQERETLLAQRQNVTSTQVPTTSNYSAIPSGNTGTACGTGSSSSAARSYSTMSGLGSVISGLSSAISGSASSGGYVALRQSDEVLDDRSNYIQMEDLSSRAGYQSLEPPDDIRAARTCSDSFSLEHGECEVNTDNLTNS